jgi:hypothetical protein
MALARVVRRTLCIRAVHVIADRPADRWGFPGKRYRLLHRCRRRHAENYRYCFRGSAAG